MLRDTAKPLSSVTWIFPPPIEIPVTLIVLRSFLTVIFVVFGWGALLSFWMVHTILMPRLWAISKLF